MTAYGVKIRLVAPVFVGTMFLASIALAQQGGAGGGQPDLVGWMDKDKDGKISRTEWCGDPKAFAKYDKNSDNSIASDEKPTGMPTIDIMDKNGDGKITKDEFPTDAPAGMFEQFDQDKDGSLNANEIASPPTAGGGGGAADAGGAQGGAAPTENR